jgi:hypothetical protein
MVVEENPERKAERKGAKESNPTPRSKVWRSTLLEGEGEKTAKTLGGRDERKRMSGKVAGRV